MLMLSASNVINEDREGAWWEEKLAINRIKLLDIRMNLIKLAQKAEKRWHEWNVFNTVFLCKIFAKSLSEEKELNGITDLLK